MAGRHAWHVRWGLQVPRRADMSARSTCTSCTQPHTLWRLSGQGGESKTKSNRVSGRHEWHKRVKARERCTKRRTDTIGTRHEGCKVARGECKACRKTKAGLGLSRHAWRKHVANGKGEVCRQRQAGHSLTPCGVYPAKVGNPRQRATECRADTNGISA